MNPTSGAPVLGVQVADLATELDKMVVVEPCEAELYSTGVVKPGISREVGGQALSERGKALHALRAVKERRRAGNQQVQAWVTATVDLVEHLAQSVERFISGIGADPLQGLDLVDHQEQSGVAAVSQDPQQTLQERQRSGMVDLTFDPSGALHRRGHVGLTAEPGQQTIGGGLIAGVGGVAVGTQDCSERRRSAHHVAEALFHERVGGGDETGRVGFGDDSCGKHVFFEHVEPTVDHRPQRAYVAVADRQPLNNPAIDGLQVVQRRLRLRNLKLGGSEPLATGSFCDPPSGEGLAAPPLASDRFKHGPASGDLLQVLVHRVGKALEPDSHYIEASGRHGAPAQRVDDLVTTGRADLDGQLSSTSI